MKSRNKSLRVNFFMNATLSISSMFFPILSFPYVSRVLSPENIGKVSFATSVITYFSMFAQLGIPTYGIRVCAKVRDDRFQLSKTVHELLIINAITCLISYCALAAVICTVPKIREEKTLYVIMSFTILLNVIGMEWLYKALEEYTYITLRSVVFKFISLLLLFGFVHNREDYQIYGAISIFAVSASNFLNFCNAHKYICLKNLKQYNVVKHLKPILVFFAMACATKIYTNMDTVMLGFISNNKEVGLYSVAIKVKDILVGLITALGTVVLPRAAYYIEHDRRKEFQCVSQMSLSIITIMTIPLVSYFQAFARECILFLAGPAYVGSIVPMQIIILSLVSIGLTHTIGIQILVPLGKEKQVLVAECAGAIVNLCANSILIPAHGAVGAAIGTLCAELAVLFVEVCALPFDLKMCFRRIEYWKVMGALIPGLVSCYWIKNTRWYDLIKLIISGSVFGIVYIIMLYLMKQKLITEAVDRFLKTLSGYGSQRRK